MAHRWVLILALALAACGGSSPGQHPAEISGTLDDVGGPAGTPDRPVSGTVLLDSGQLHYKAQADSTGHWSVKVAPGSYRITGTAGGLTCTGGSVLAASGLQATIQVACPIK